MSNSDDFKTGQGSMRRGTAIHNLQMTLLKRSLSRFSEADARLWGSFLSTSYGELRVTQDLLSLVIGNLQRLEQSRSTNFSEKAKAELKHCFMIASEAKDDLEQTAQAFSDLREAFTKKTGPYAS